MNDQTKKSYSESVQFCGLRIKDNLYGVDVLKVQEIIGPRPVTIVPYANDYIRGLINLRGQIITGVSLRVLLDLQDPLDNHHMNVIIRNNGNPYCLVVDEIDDIITVHPHQYGPPPETLEENKRKIINGIYKLENELMIHLNVDSIAEWNEA